MSVAKKIEKVVIHCGDLNNIGDFILLISTIQSLREIPALRNAKFFYYVWTSIPEDKKLELEKIGVDLLNGKTFYSFTILNRQTLTVWGGGQLFRENGSIASMIATLLRSILSNLSGSRLAILGCGISNVKGWRRAIYREVVKSSFVITVRDKTSFDRANAWFGAKGVLTEDIVHTNKSLYDALSKNSLRNRIIVSLCKDESEGRRFSDSQCIEILKKATPLLRIDSIDIVAHDVRESMDLGVAREFSQALQKNGVASNYKALNTIKDVIILYETSSLVITNRLHSAIFGLISGARVLILDDGNKKLQDFASTYELELLKLNKDNPIDIERALQLSDHKHSNQNLHKKLAIAAARSTENFKVLESMLN